MTLLAAVQVPPVREMRTGLERKYRVEVVQEAGDRYAYRLRTRVVVPKLPSGATGSTELRLELRLTDYQATLEGQSTRAALMGGGEVPVEPTGLPNGLNVTGPQGPVWLPLIAFYFPSVDEGSFELAQVPVGSGLEMVGKGRVAKAKDGSQVEIDASFVAGSRTFGKLTLSTWLDGSGWPERAEGRFASEDGTYHLTLQRA